MSYECGSVISVIKSKTCASLFPFSYSVNTYYVLLRQFFWRRRMQKLLMETEHAFVRLATCTRLACISNGGGVMHYQRINFAFEPETLPVELQSSEIVKVTMLV